MDKPEDKKHYSPLLSLLNIKLHGLKIKHFQWINALKNVNNGLNTNIYSYLETSGGQSSNLYLNVVHFFNTGVN